MIDLSIIQIQTVTGFMNKENIVKNISLLSRKKSPTPNKSMNAQVSFKNINPTKSFYKHSHNHTDLSMSPISTKRIKTQAFRQNSVIHTEISESSLSTHNNNLSQAFKLERQSLLNTLAMYKQQLEITNQEQHRTKKESNKLKVALKEKDESIGEHIKRNAELTQKVYDYENMLPKLIQLEQLQEKIIHENNGLKNRIKMQEALINNVSNITKYEENKSPALQKIHSLAQSYLSTVPSIHRKHKER